MPDKTKKIDGFTEDEYNLWSKYANGFSESLYGTIQALNQMNKSYYQPTMGSQYIQNVNISPYKCTQAELKTWLENPSKFKKMLDSVSQYLENSIMQYKRTVDHFVKILLFRYDMRSIDKCKNKTEIKTWESGYNRCLEFLRKFNLPYQALVTVQKAMSTGGYFGYLKENNNFSTLIEIPTDYCYITGRWDLGWTYAIDLTWFDRIIGVEKAVPEIYDEYKIFVEMRKAGLMGERLAPYQYYAVPVEKSFVLTFDILRPQVVPPFAGVFRDALAVLEYKDLLKQKAQLDTWKLVAQVIPRDKDNKPVVPAQIARELVSIIQTSFPAGSATFATPFDVKEIDFGNAQNMNNMIGMGESLYWRSVGVNGAVLDGSDKTIAAVTASLRNDYGFVEHIYRQFENWINFQLLLRSKQKRFKISIYGNRYTEPEDINLYTEACSRLNFPIGKLFGLHNIQPYEIDGILEAEDRLGWKDKLKPILSAFNTKGIGDKNSGRPEKSDDSKADGGAKTKDYQSNENKGGE